MSAILIKLLWISLIINVLLAGVGLWAVQKLGGWDSTLYRLRHKGLSGIYENRKTLFGVLKGEQSDIIWLGDSLTEKGEWAELFGDARHKNRGISGDYAAGILERLPTILTGYPKAIFLMVGTNDLLMGMAPAKLMTYYQKIVRQIREENPGTQLVLQSVLPINTQKWVLPKKNKVILEFNQLIQDLAKAEKLEYIDLHSIMIDRNGLLDEKYTYDGIHLNGDAYLMWTKKLGQVVEQL